jgi:hypothetical protein
LGVKVAAFSQGAKAGSLGGVCGQAAWAATGGMRRRARRTARGTLLIFTAATSRPENAG